MVPTAPDAASGPSTLKMRVEGMDCGSCALKVENALKRLPGLSDINVNVAAGSVAVSLDEQQTSRLDVESRIRALGYSVMPAQAAAVEGPVGLEDPARNARPWWKSNAGVAIVLALLLLAAYAVSVFRPDLKEWAFGAAALVGLTPFAVRAFTAARAGTPFSIETLMTVAAVGAVAIGTAEEAAAVIFLFAIGEVLESIAARRARAGIVALMNLVPRQARLEREGRLEEVPVERLRVGDVVVVGPGDRVPSDGDVVEGQSEVNEAPITGESVPVPKEPGDRVFAGSINANGTLRVRLTHSAADNTIARIIHLVEEAQAAKAPIARYIDRFAAWYTPAALAVSALVIALPPLALGADWYTWIYRGLATLLIACPCALVISTPAAIASGLAAGARRGLLVKGGAALETLGKVRVVAFDKTGTLTIGQPRVTDVLSAEGATEDELLSNAAAVEYGSSHPLGEAIVAEALRRGLAVPPMVGGSAAIPGKAVIGRVGAASVAVGSPSYAAEQAELSRKLLAGVATLESSGKTVVVVLRDRRPLGLIAMRDEPREDARAGLAALGRLGVRSVMLTGDNPRTAAAIGDALGIDVQAGLLPDAKLRAIAACRDEGEVAMVGDGINDAPALAAASVGIAMGSGTDVALETADAALLKNRVSGIAELIALSRATLANIRQNIAVALGLKAVFLAFTLAGSTPLWMAILADTGATVLVTANALRLLRFRA